ncbi:hypothetical protein SODALDRAFT_120474 [Sodiomyces alkalinus F11]|uniref:Autophagy-related protein 2 n=1 Tax=Sodiomyces alkalinus (strain CBS 110278 / VKM F-3762 / F11) TaxID=1314773 RepID=A0A3N2Q4A2_SODAK|nr:hypothetical protein SODALDRAFT_120474 [Sodiomyces alkalinus F11]ROT41478.1 hypothetical protein SODALDRAFT_120474 [Sodiomyces alkalinus F11]
MATFFQSFRSSTMPKRLLRYALSRLELLEDETLDLDNLDFALGRNTTFEFRDVGVRLKKLEQMLKLPPSFKLQRAKVLRLNVTIPMDFYTSPIIVEVDGVDIRLKMSGRNEEKGKNTSKTRRRADVVPHTFDLAASFLETQPPDEKKRLQDALEAETQDFGASVSLSDSAISEEDESGFGTGEPLSLPAFLADFLQGIVDRTQVHIQGVTFQLDVEVPLEASPTATDIVTFQIALDRIDVEGVTTEVSDGSGESLIQPKEGKRNIALSQVRAFLISEANVFSIFSRSPSVSSPVVSQTSSFSEPVPASPSPTAESSTPIIPHLHDSRLDDSVHLNEIDEALLHDSEAALQIPYELDDDPEQEEENGNTPRASLHQESFPFPGIPFRSNDLSGEVHESPWVHSELPVQPTSQPSFDLLQEEAEETPLPESGTLWASQCSPTGCQSPELKADDDLAQSHLFTHEEAESMYMSAFSHTNSEHLPSQAPGEWHSQLEPSPSSLNATTESRQPSSPTKPISMESEFMHQGTDDSSSFLPTTEASHPTSPPQAEHEESDEESAQPQPIPEASEDNAVEPSQDDVATPRGPTRLAKEIIALDRISIYIPSRHKHLHVQPAIAASAAQSTMSSARSVNSAAAAMPGAFSTYPTSPRLEASIPPQPKPAQPTEPQADDALEVFLSPLEIRFDASLGFLLATVVGKLLEAINGAIEASAEAGEATTQGQQHQPKDQSSDGQLPAIRVCLERISLLFLNQLRGVADTAERMMSSSGMHHLQPEILLQTVLENVSICSKTQGATRETKVDLGRFKFGYANDDIVCFDQSLQMRASVRDEFPSAGADVSVLVTKSSDSTRTKVTTLPLLVQLDLQRLDETFSWFGGLSSFLNVSSSMASSPSSSIKNPVQVVQVQQHQKPRGVRFQTPINPNDKSAASENKVDMRIGGFNLKLNGKDCSAALETSAVKMISRDTVIVFSTSKARLAGPFLRNSRAGPPIVAEMDAIRFDFQNHPMGKDLERLLELITPSKAKFDEGDDEIMVDTLLRQRRKGAVLLVSLGRLNVKVSRMEQLGCLSTLGEEVSRLSTVAKYLPEDDRPGLLTLGNIGVAHASLDFGGKVGTFYAGLKELDVAHITFPSLVALGVSHVSLNRNEREDLISSPDPSSLGASSQGPVVMMRMVGDEMEPAIKVRMRDVTFEYRVPTVMDVLGLAADATPQDFEATLAASVANLGEQAHLALHKKRSPISRPGELKQSHNKPTKVDVVFRHCFVGLNPLDRMSKLVIALTDARFEVGLPKDVDTAATFHINKASLLLTDDVSKMPDQDGQRALRRNPQDRSSQWTFELMSRGFVNICYISAAKVNVKVIGNGEDGEKQVDIELRDNLLILETCADSTQTLISLANALTPPTPPSKEAKYRTEVVPVQDLLASISNEAFGRAEGVYDFDADFPLVEAVGSDDDFDFPTGSGTLPATSQHHVDTSTAEPLFDAGNPLMSGSLGDSAAGRGKGAEGLGANLHSSTSDVSDTTSELVMDEDYFTKKPDLDSFAWVWNSTNNCYDRATPDLVKRSPVRVSVRDVHVIWNLFDGFDWDRTRNEITKTVEKVEHKAMERRNAVNEEEDEVDVIGDYLFNSIYIGIPANRDPRELAQMINDDLNDGATFTETESIATTAVTATGGRGGPKKKRKLRLDRSKRHKITFELQGVHVDAILFPPGSGETQSSIDVRVHTLEVFDHVPTSTWKKFATYDKDAGEREMDTSMVRIELLNVKPNPDLAASDIILLVNVLPLRLHVDQDALDFITRFFEFKDDAVPVHSSPSDVPFLQRVEVMDIPVQLDFKPKRVDYGGLKSGRTTEFMNFIILDQAHLTLRHTIIYGVSGFDRMGKTLNDIWMPDVKETQLPGVLAGLAPIRNLVTIGSGFKDLIEIPVREYQKDGRIFRGIKMGATAFARTTGTGVVKLGAKVAIGTQSALQEAEGLLLSKPAAAEATSWDGDDPSDTDEQPKKISLYAEQPMGVIQGLRGGYAGLARDLNLARDAIIAVPGEVMESQNAKGLAKVMMKRAPTIVFRPVIGASKAIGQTLMGATNALDPENRRRVSEKYKQYSTSGGI